MLLGTPPLQHLKSVFAVLLAEQNAAVALPGSLLLLQRIHFVLFQPPKAGLPPVRNQKVDTADQLEEAPLQIVKKPACCRQT